MRVLLLASREAAVLSIRLLVPIYSSRLEQRLPRCDPTATSRSPSTCVLTTTRLLRSLDFPVSAVDQQLRLHHPKFAILLRWRRLENWYQLSLATITTACRSPLPHLFLSYIIMFRGKIFPIPFFFCLGRGYYFHLVVRVRVSRATIFVQGWRRTTTTAGPAAELGSYLFSLSPLRTLSFLPSRANQFLRTRPFPFSFVNSKHGVGDCGVLSCLGFFSFLLRLFLLSVCHLPPPLSPCFHYYFSVQSIGRSVASAGTSVRS